METEIYSNLFYQDKSFYAGLVVIATSIISVGILFYFDKKDSLKNFDSKEGNLEKKLEKKTD